MSNRRPEITEEKVEQIRLLMTNHPDWNRSKLSDELCELWDWKSAAGQPKNISCRDVLRALESSGKIVLPPPQRRGHQPGGITHIQLRMHETSPIEASLKDISPLTVEIADSKDMIAEFKSYIDQYHYLAYGQSVGECMRYFVRANSGRIVACLLFGSSAWRCSPRDKHIGWSDGDRVARLHLTSNNTRFLIPQWIRVSCLASHVLSLVSRRVSGDWQRKYGHPLFFLETYVDRSRFVGTCYKAANWQCVGETTGLGRNSTSNRPTLPIKDVYVYPLVKDFRKKLVGSSQTVPGGVVLR